MRNPWGMNAEQPWVNIVTSPAFHAFAIVKSDSADFDVAVRGIYVGVTGDVAVVTVNNEVVVFKAFPAGQIIPIMAKRVNSTNTSATDMVGLY